MKKTAILLTLLLLVSALWAQNRYALVIGNTDYPRVDDKLPNAINDTDDISRELKDLGFTVTLRQNLRFREMVREINAFVAQLSNRNSEGFFWYGGHAVELGGKNYLLPLDVDTEDEDMTIATSYSVTTLLERLEGVRNKINVVVLDACRVPPRIGGGGRGRGDTARVIKTMPQVPPDVLVVYSTSSGAVAYDGEGKRNSPFTEAFKKHIKSGEPLIQMVSHVTTETQTLTGQRQRPYTSGSMGSENAYYSLNPAGSRSDTSQVTQLIPEGLEWEIVDDNRVIITKYKGNAATVQIPEKIQGLPVTGIGRDAFSYYYKLTNVTIPSSVTTIGDCAFVGTGLTSVAIPSSVSIIGTDAFYGCGLLTSINVDSYNNTYSSVDGVLFDKNMRTIEQYPVGRNGTYSIPSSVTAIGSWAFSGCNNLTGVTIPSSVISIGNGVFYSCVHLTDINIDSRNNTYSSVDGILFSKNMQTIVQYPAGKNEKAYTIPSSVKTIGNYAFNHCRLTSVTIPSSVTSIGNSTFYGSSLISITIPSSVTSIGDSAFWCCGSLTSISIPFSVTSIGNSTFSYCGSLTKINIPSSVTTIGDYAFYECENLTSVTFQGTIPSSGFSTSDTFPGDLRDKFYASNSSNGTPGTYTRLSGSSTTWTKQ